MSYEDRKRDRIERLRARATKTGAASESKFADAHAEIAGIPPGQPILVGHHSERRHRRALEKHDNKMRAAFDLQKKAKHAARRADSAECRTAIDSDDPEACDKLRALIADLRANHDKAKKCNRLIRGKKSDAEIAAALDWKESTVAKAREPDFCGRVGFPAYWMQNSLANIKRYENRLADLSRAPFEASETDYGNGVVCRVDPDEGRVYFDTPGKNTGATLLLRGRGWCWSGRNGCWSRKITHNAIHAAAHVGPQIAQVYE